MMSTCRVRNQFLYLRQTAETLPQAHDVKTAGVKILVEEVLGAMSKPYSEHVIDEVFAAIEHSPVWRRQYDLLCGQLGKDLTNNSVGYWVAAGLGKTGKKQVAGTRSSLNGSYSILDTDARTFNRKPTEQEALALMAEYYQAHKKSLPPRVREHREELVALIVAGTHPEDAFSLVLRDAV